MMRTYAFALFTSLLTLLVSGCGGGRGATTSTATQEGDPITIEAEKAVKAVGKYEAPPGVKGTMTSGGFVPDEPTDSDNN